MSAIISYIVLVVLLCSGQHFAHASTESAWNGVVLPGALPSAPNPAEFVPYFVPKGDQSVDDTSPSIVYSKDFRMQRLRHSVNGTQHVSTKPSSAAEFRFYGARVEWFGDKTPYSGIASVSIDGVFIGFVDSYSPQVFHQQRLFSAYNLDEGEHILRVASTANRNSRSRGYALSIDAFVIPLYGVKSADRLLLRTESQVPFARGWTLEQRGTTGVSAMQLAIVSDTHAILIDKVEHNLLDINGHPAWAALYDLLTDEVRPLAMRSNSFCAGGTWLSNGTLLNIGGNPVVESKTGSADFGDLDGLQAIRMFNPCDGGDCDILEFPDRIRLTTPRWYSSATRLEDGSVMIIGGSLKGGWMNNQTTNNPTIEFFPPKNINGFDGLPIPLQFLSDTLNANLFVIAFTLPDGRVFIAANQDATIYDWRTDTEQRLPKIPNGVRVTYPMTGTGVLLPLSPQNDYTPEVMLCGGSSIDDTRPGYEISSQAPASSQCSRMVLTDDGVAAGWSVESMPQARIMPDAVTLPDGRIVIVNGGGSGIAGYGNVIGQVGESNAANPVLTPAVYDPTAPIGSGFSTDMMPISNIPRLYHSVASLTPNGSVMIAGSNPNLDRSNVEYGTEYRVEWLNPPYMTSPKPAVSGIPAAIGYGMTFTVHIEGIGYAQDVKVSLMDLGFVTHGVHMNGRLVYLSYRTSSTNSSSLIVSAPPSGRIYPPGPAWLYVLVNGVPSIGKKTMVGDGASPPVDNDAIASMLSKTVVKSSPVTHLNDAERRHFKSMSR